MKKILCITDFYYPKPLANGICLEQIVLELKKRNNEVHVLCLGESKNQEKINNDGIDVHFINKRLFHRLLEYGEKYIDTFKGKLAYNTALLINRANKFMLLPFYPMSSLSSIIAYYKKIKILQLENSYDLIISTYCPFDGLIGGLIAKLKFSETIKYGIYMLDTLSNVGNSKWFSSQWMEKRGMNWEKIIFPHADFILYMRTHYTHHEKEFYEPYKARMKVVDTPLFSSRFDQKNIPKTKMSNSLFWLYAGAFYAGRREPDYVCEIIMLLNNTYNERANVIHFYSRGDCEETIAKYQELTDGWVIRHGYVHHSEVFDAVEKADILISVGNNNSEMVPSKIFEYMSTGKKIIHFYEDTNDSCISYFEKYPNALLINMKDDKGKNITTINNFLDKDCTTISYDNIEEIFIENTPKYTVNKIEEFL